MFDEARLQQLTAAYFDRQLSGENKRELEAMLLGSARAREIFQEQAGWHGLTREWALRENARDLMDGISLAPLTRMTSWRRRMWWTGAGLAAGFAMLWAVLQFNPDQPHPVTAEARPAAALREEVAMLGQTLNAVWENDAVALTAGTALRRGWLHLRAGTLRLDFYSGARVYLEGPASLELVSQDLARLERGRLTANVPPAAEGFTVLNANLRVVDRGTEFGMNAGGPGECEVHVFQGEVELQGDVPAATARALFEGDAVAIREGQSTILTANRASFADPAAVTQAAAREAETLRQAWRTASESFRATPGLLVYFDFEDLEPGASLVPNRARDGGPDSMGTVIGCDRLTGRWAEKAALGFARTSDRVRFRLSGSQPSLTMMAWVRVDSLPLDHNALLSMAPGQVGEIHWKLDRSGKLLLGLRAVDALAFESWERLESPPVVTEQDFGHWMHLATVIDGGAGMMRHFVNGREVASGAIIRPTAIRLGPANLGNFDAAIASSGEMGVVRHFNGRIDGFALVGRALTAAEIQSAAQ